MIGNAALVIVPILVAVSTFGAAHGTVYSAARYGSPHTHTSVPQALGWYMCRVRHPFPDAIYKWTTDLGHKMLDSLDGQCMERKKGTLLGTERPLSSNVIRLESYENGWK